MVPGRKYGAAKASYKASRLGAANLFTFGRKVRAGISGSALLKAQRLVGFFSGRLLYDVLPRASSPTDTRQALARRGLM